MCSYYLDGDRPLSSGGARPVIPVRPDRSSVIGSVATVQFSRTAGEGCTPAARHEGRAAGERRSLKTQQHAPAGAATVCRGRRARSGRRARPHGRWSLRRHRARELDAGHDAVSCGPPKGLPRKEVIQPHLPVRLPCYDFTPVTSPTFDGSLPCGLGHRLRVLLTPVV